MLGIKAAVVGVPAAGQHRVEKVAHRGEDFSPPDAQPRLVLEDEFLRGVVQPLGPLEVVPEALEPGGVVGAGPVAAVAIPIAAVAGFLVFPDGVDQQP